MHIAPNNLNRDAPCKVNLTLDVFLPRADGFHDLESIATKFSPSDKVQVYCGSSNSFWCSDSSLPGDDKNLAVLAGLRYFQDSKKHGVKVVLVKNLPYQAGLGSASSDAATVLRAINDFPEHARSEGDRVSKKWSWVNYAFPDDYLWYPKKTEEELIAIAASIGSDVPMFLIPGPVHMQGRGEIVAPLGLPLPTLHGVLVKPHVGVSTPIAYKLLDAVPNRVPGNATQKLLSVLQSPHDISAIASALGNDFEAVVLPAFPEVAEAHRAVTEAGAIRALLCGSGSAVFGLTESKEQATEIVENLRASNRFAWVEVAESLP